MIGSRPNGMAVDFTGGTVTWVVTWLSLLLGLLSGVFEVTLASLVMVLLTPGTLIDTLSVDVAPTARSGRVACKPPGRLLMVQPLPEALTSLAPGGNRSVTTTLLAVKV